MKKYRLVPKEVYEFVKNNNTQVSARILCENKLVKQITAASSLNYLVSRGFLEKIKDYSIGRKRIFYKITNKDPCWNNIHDSAQQGKALIVKFMKDATVKYTVKDIEKLIVFPQTTRATNCLSSLSKIGIINKVVIRERGALVAYYFNGIEPEEKYSEFKTKKYCEYKYGRADCQEFKEFNSRAVTRNIFNQAMSFAL